MVSLENGRFILRRRQQPSTQTRLLRLFPRARKIALIAVILMLWSHFIRRASETSIDHEMLRATREADVITVMDDERDVQRRDDLPDSFHMNVLHTFNEVDDTNNNNNEGGDEDEVEYSQTNASADERTGYQNNVNSEDQFEGDADNDDGDDDESDDGEGAKVQSLTLNKTYLEHLRTLDPIPKMVHIFFPDKEYFKRKPILPFVSHSIISLMTLNPDWNVTVYDDTMIDRIIQEAGDTGLISKNEVDILIGTVDEEEEQKQSAHIVERSDIARLILMYQIGGVYLDVDRLVSRKFSDIFTQNSRLCLPTHFGINFAQDIMCSSKGNKLFLSIIRKASTIRMESERKEGWMKSNLLFDLGPTLYNSQILMNVFGMDSDAYDRHADDEGFFMKARDAISTSYDLIITKQETDYCNSTLVLDYSIPGCPSREELYERYKMKPWSDEVDARWES